MGPHPHIIIIIIILKRSVAPGKAPGHEVGRKQLEPVVRLKTPMASPHGVVAAFRGGGGATAPAPVAAWPDLDLTQNSLRFIHSFIRLFATIFTDRTAIYDVGRRPSTLERHRSCRSRRRTEGFALGSGGWILWRESGWPVALSTSDARWPVGHRRDRRLVPRRVPDPPPARPASPTPLPRAPGRLLAPSCPVHVLQAPPPVH